MDGATKAGIGSRRKEKLNTTVGLYACAVQRYPGRPASLIIQPEHLVAKLTMLTGLYFTRKEANAIPLILRFH